MWATTALLTALLVLVYLFMEWLFFATKPSFLTLLPFSKQLGVLATSLWIPLLLTSTTILLFGFFSLLSRETPIGKICRATGRTVPALILACTLLLIADNFTITVFDVGIRSFHGFVKFAYAAFLFFLIAWCYRWFYHLNTRITAHVSERRLWTVFIIAVVVLVLPGLVSYVASAHSFDRAQYTFSAKAASNILLIGSDGLEADHLSVYGYATDTTPFLRQFANDALIAESAYANSHSTLGSLVSILTGRLPTQTRLIAAPDILRGDHAYQHLPGLLRMNGYRTIQLSTRPYADAYDANMRAAFDSVNLRSPGELRLYEITNRLLEQESAYFLQQSFERITQRLFHILGIRNMEDPFLIITHRRIHAYTDEKRIKALLDFIQSSDKPFFAHVHLMGTHKAMMRREDSTYDEAIHNFDLSFRKIIEFLVKTDRLEKTVVAIYSDHGRKHSTRKRVPLIIRFPAGEQKGHVSGVAQNIDIGPTLLRYLQIPKPAWMNGQSLIPARGAGCRWVISVRPIPTTDPRLKLKVRAEAKGPFYTLGDVSVIACGRYFRFNLEKKKIVTNEAANKVDVCSDCKVPSRADVIGFIRAHLRQNGYDVSSF